MEAEISLTSQHFTKKNNKLLWKFTSCLPLIFLTASLQHPNCSPMNAFTVIDKSWCNQIESQQRRTPAWSNARTHTVNQCRWVEKEMWKMWSSSNQTIARGALYGAKSERPVKNTAKRIAGWRNNALSIARKGVNVHRVSRSMSEFGHWLNTLSLLRVRVAQCTKRRKAFST